MAPDAQLLPLGDQKIFYFDTNHMLANPRFSFLLSLEHSLVNSENKSGIRERQNTNDIGCYYFESPLR